MRLKSKTAFQHYEEFEGWQQNQESLHNNLLHKFNENLSSYQQKYRKNIMLSRPNKITEKHINQPYLPYIQHSSDHNFVLKKKQSNKKIFFNENSFSQYKQNKQLVENDGQIFQQRRSKYLKLKAIGLQERKSQRKLKEKVDVRDNSLQQMNILKYIIKIPKAKHESFKIREKQNYYKRKQALQEFSDKELFTKINKQFF